MVKCVNSKPKTARRITRICFQERTKTNIDVDGCYFFTLLLWLLLLLLLFLCFNDCTYSCCHPSCVELSLVFKKGKHKFNIKQILPPQL